jgi:hypothetical protein
VFSGGFIQETSKVTQSSDQITIIRDEMDFEGSKIIVEDNSP